MDSVSFPVMAGSAAAAASLAELLTIPLDTAKVRLQVGARRGLLTTVVDIVKREGPAAPWNGLTAGLHRQLVYATFRIATYPHIRDLYNKYFKTLGVVPDFVPKVLAGMTSGALGMILANPTELVKVRLQADALSAASSSSSSSSSSVLATPRYRGAIDAYSSIVKSEGVLGLWRGLTPNIVRNAIVCAAEMAAYDEFKECLLKFNKDGLPVHLTAGFAAGFTATVVGSPVDVVKTRYMNAGGGGGVFNCVRGLYREAGPRGFYKGFVPNCLRVSTFNMLVFVFYERFLRLYIGE